MKKEQIEKALPNKIQKNLSDFVKVPNELSGILKDVDSIYTIRIIFHLINKLRSNQYLSKAQQLYLDFDQDFLSSNNMFTNINIDLKELAIDRKNIDRLKITLEKLADFKKGWRKVKNLEGKTRTVYCGFIEIPNFDKNQCSFLMSSYWLEKILDIGTHYYNEALYKIPFIVSSTVQINFYLWLHKIKNRQDGIKITLSFFNETFNLNYIEEKECIKTFLKPVKEKLDMHSDISFNFKNLGKNKGFIIIPYLTKKIINMEKLKEIDKEKLKKNYKFSYIKKRHKLDDKNSLVLKEIYLKIKNHKTINILNEAYNNFIIGERKKKIKVSDYRGVEFLKKFQEYIILEYNKTKEAKLFSNHYPKVI